MFLGLILPMPGHLPCFYVAPEQAVPGEMRVVCLASLNPEGAGVCCQNRALESLESPRKWAHSRLGAPQPICECGGETRCRGLVYM